MGKGWCAHQLGDGSGEQKLALTMLRLHRDKKELGVVADQVGCPSSTLNLARASWRLIIAAEGMELPPVLHWCDGGAASWYDVAVAVGELAWNWGY